MTEAELDRIDREQKERMYAESSTCAHCKAPIERIEDAVAMMTNSFGWASWAIYHRQPCVALAILKSTEGAKARNPGMSVAAARRMFR